MNETDIENKKDFKALLDEYSLNGSSDFSQKWLNAMEGELSDYRMDLYDKPVIKDLSDYRTLVWEITYKRNMQLLRKHANSILQQKNTADVSLMHENKK